MEKNKRAVSALIATVLIIGITIAAFGIVYAYIIPVIREGIEASRKCSDMQLNIDTAKGHTFYNTTGISIMVSRGPKSGDLAAVHLKATDNTGNSVTLKNTDLTVIPQSATPGPNEDMTYWVDATEHGLSGTPQTVAIAAIIQLGNKEVACDLIPETYINAQVA